MSKRYTPLMGLIALLTSCGALPPAHIYSGGKVGYVNDGYAPEGFKVGARGYRANEGRDFCRDLENRARVRAVQQLGTGWTYGILAALAIGAGTVLTASTPNNPTNTRNALNASLPVAGAALGYLSFGEFSREKDASDVAATAATALNLKNDEEANKVCNEAIGSWNKSRPNSNDALTKALLSEQKHTEDDSEPRQKEPAPVSSSPKESPKAP